MKLSEIYHENSIRSATNSDYQLFKVSKNSYIGSDKNMNVVYCVVSSDTRCSAIKLKTKYLSVDCNLHVNVIENGVVENHIVHMISCFKNSDSDIDIFLDLCEIFFVGTEKMATQEYFVLVFNTLQSFFSSKLELTDNELQGLFAELFTMYSFVGKINLFPYWQSEEKMKFDFSINSKVKIEIKSTVLPLRKHHFVHEQLMNELYDIYVISYLLRSDDNGLSIYDLINVCQGYLENESSKLMRLMKIKNDVSKERLVNMKFETNYIYEKRRIIRSEKIPRFSESSPEGVINAEYDCILENIEYLSDTEFIDIMNKTIMNVPTSEVNNQFIAQ